MERTHELPDQSVAVRYIVNREIGMAHRYAAAVQWLWRERAWLGTRDIIHCHLTFGAALGSLFKLLASLTGQSRQRPAVVETYHAVGMPIPKLHRWLHTRMAAGRDALSFMVDDPYWRAFLSRHPQLKGTVIPIGVEAPRIERISQDSRAAYRASLGIPEGVHVVGTIGRLAPERQSHMYTEVFARIAQELGPNVHFFMGGDGPERRLVEACIAKHGLEDRVHLPGLVTDVERAFSIFDLYVTSNVGAVCGVAGLQAIGAGIPTIALQLLDDFQSGEQDFVWSSTDPGTVGERAASLLRSKAAAVELVAEQRKNLELRHSAAAMAAAYERLYGEALASVRRS